MRRRGMEERVGKLKLLIKCGAFTSRYHKVYSIKAKTRGEIGSWGAYTGQRHVVSRLAGN